MDNRAISDDVDSKGRLISYVMEGPNDEIDLGRLIRGLVGEWKIMAFIIVIGVIGSIAVMSFLPKTYQVEALLRAPSIHELGDIRDQNFIDVTPEYSMTRVIDHLLSPEVQRYALEVSGLEKHLLGNGEYSNGQLVQALRRNFSLNIVRHDYYQLEEGEKGPLKEIDVSLKSDAPALAAEFIQLLVKQAQALALRDISNDVVKVKNSRIDDIRKQLRSMALAVRQSREAEIMRLQESNNEQIFRLEQQIDLKIRKARQDRENRATRLGEALKTAEMLGIEEPVTWDDLRPLRKSTQITNELGGKENSMPLYFRGTRLLRAEFDQLTSRVDDKPFIEGLTDLENQITQLRNDPRVEALKARTNDTIYVEKYDELQIELERVQMQPDQFSNTQLAVVSQPATISSQPLHSTLKIVVAAFFVSGFLALIIALIRHSLRTAEPKIREQRLTAAN